MVNDKAAQPWNKGKLVGQKAPLRLGEIWAIRVRHLPPRKGYEQALTSGYFCAGCRPLSTSRVIAQCGTATPLGTPVDPEVKMT